MQGSVSLLIAGPKLWDTTTWSRASYLDNYCPFTVAMKYGMDINEEGDSLSLVPPSGQHEDLPFPNTARELILHASSRYLQGLSAVLSIMTGQADVLSHHSKVDYNRQLQ